MKYLLIISCLLFTSVSWSKDINSDDLVIRDGLYYEKFTDVPFTGNILWYAYKDKNIITIKVSYKDGKREGENIHYWENGQLYKTEIYKDGELIETIKP